MTLRVVFDTSTLVSAALRIGSVPYQALSLALATCDLCASLETITELEQVLNREKLDRYLDRPLRQEFVALIRRNSRLFLTDDIGPNALDPSGRDHQDNKFLALALAASTDLLVSSDQDLLVLSPWHQIQILTPGEFLARSGA